MPSPNNPPCPYCNHPSPRKNGKTKAGLQRYLCPECNRSFSDSPSGHGGHRRGVKGGDPDRIARNMRAYRARKKNKKESDK